MIANLVEIRGDRARAGELEWPVNPEALASLQAFDLFEALFPEGEPRAWYGAQKGPLLIQGDEGVRGAHWETMREGKDYVALTRGMARVIEGCEGSGAVVPAERALRVLFAMASPVLNPGFEPEDDGQPTPINLQARVDLLLDLDRQPLPAEFHVCRHVSVTSPLP